jgi:uncharacterized protein YbaR (Trm112 family)
MPDSQERVLDPVLLEVIACPACHGGLDLSSDARTLACSSCRVAYPVQDGVPVLLGDEARPLGETNESVTNDGGEDHDDRR